MPPTKTPKVRPLHSTHRDIVRHPSAGGTRGYSMSQRDNAMAIFDRGDENLDLFNELREERNHPAKRTTYRWNHRRDERGSYIPYIMNGNNPATTLQGFMLFQLAMYRLAFPKCTHAELNAFLFNSTPLFEEPRFFAASQLSRAEDMLGLSLKRSSTTARQANLPKNIAKRNVFWTQPYPYGISDISYHDMIDWDEAGIFIETTDRGYGKVYVGNRCREEGPYNHSQKYTLTLAIAGSVQGERWLKFEAKSGTGLLDVVDFIGEILEELPNGNEHRRRCFTCDNLISHKDPIVRQLIYAHGHRLCLRAPYNPRDGASEYVFNTIQQQLTLRMHTITNREQLEEAINEILLGIYTFCPYFEHINYHV